VGAITLEQEAEIPNYHRLPAPGVMQSFLERNMRHIPLREAKPLDVVLVPICGRPMHLALLTDYAGHGGVEPPFGVLHAMVDMGFVREQRFDASAWTIRGVYRFHELEEPEGAA
jgi:hypothetical protein